MTVPRTMSPSLTSSCFRLSSKSAAKSSPPVLSTSTMCKLLAPFGPLPLVCRNGKPPLPGRAARGEGVPPRGEPCQPNLRIPGNPGGLRPGLNPLRAGFTGSGAGRGGGPLAVADDARHLIDHVVDGKYGRIHHDRVRRADQRGRFPARVALVAAADLGQGLVVHRLDPGCPQLLDPAPGAH